MVALSAAEGFRIAIGSSDQAQAPQGGRPLHFFSGGPGDLLVKLDVFDGPLDLLLRLVLAQDLDVTKVSLAAVCEQYVGYISLMESLDIGVASEYLVIAATLTFIKSKRLLPPPPAPFEDVLADDAASAEEALRERLIAYQHFKQAGDALRLRLEANRGYHFRQLPAAADPAGQTYRLQPAALARGYAEALDAAQRRPVSIRRDVFSVVDKMKFLLSALRQARTVSLFSLLAGRGRLEAVVTFVAALELIRAHKAAFTQAEPFEDVILSLASGKSERLDRSA